MKDFAVVESAKPSVIPQSMQSVTGIRRIGGKPG
jgi:hypothetical protein